ncbi:FG-GAP repeat domain-containing protein [Rhodopirellula sp. P2]|uniref:FG-GAP repeat domain-containing protein n=1 Tax=Rhodopirellula sp. P2 TaxID=2127060 RepID=UPI00236894A7|nr:VCBS repeat-containing protein [Rhodopirellula sp. P2]WDQ17977.1 VCBS repeat-containing protein [Rhodopirellula sp. P2]
MMRPTVLCVLCVAVAGCHRGETESSPSANAAPTSVNAITAFCADCHSLPNPASFEKARWQEEVEQGIRIYRQSGRRDLIIPDLDATVAFFRVDAPDQIVIPQPVRVPNDRFVEQQIPWPSENKPASISSIRVLSGEDERPRFLLSDMWTGALTLAEVTEQGFQVTELGSVSHPAHIEPVDWDQDDFPDYLVADLGTLNPQSEHQGSVWLLRGQPNGPPQRQALKLGLSRVADARTIDSNHDGKLDLLVADFGLHFVGSIHLATNQGLREGTPELDWKVVDPRPGTISLPTIDFDQDGRTDFFALITQHYETVELHRNRGDGKFEKNVVFHAQDPASGSSSIELIDFDQDGDIDVLYTNGDTFDDGLAKPNHGIKWLENEGSFPFTVHDVAVMPGCYRAVSGDIDGDGDTDIAAVAYLADEEVAKYPADSFDGVAWFEQNDDGTFTRHSLRKNTCEAATCVLIDWDSDGDLDLLVPPSTADHQPQDALRLYVNQE